MLLFPNIQPYDILFQCGTNFQQKYLETRMHSSRMRTTRLLPVSPNMHCSREGGHLPRGVCLPGGCACPGGGWVNLPKGGGCTCPGGTCPGGCTCPEVYLPRGLYLPRYSPPPYGQTDTCKNITFVNFVCRR